eukprot:gene4734-6641_t
MNFTNVAVITTIIIVWFQSLNSNIVDDVLQSNITSSSTSLNLMNHSFIFISGWPQSGTSLLQKIMTISPNISTMVEKCELKLGNRCKNWNHEGQWLLNGNSRSNFQSGSTCGNQYVLQDYQKNDIINEWSKFWNLDKHYLMEKSPQSFLKINLLKNIFNNSVETKFIVILKHPVTLNIATPKNVGWLYYKNKVNLDSNQVVAKVPVSNAILKQTFQHFIDFMSHDNSSKKECSMGWLPAMELFRSQLKNMTDANIISKSNIMIIRYESFLYPHDLCKRLFEFVYGSITSLNYITAIQEICDVSFPFMSRKQKYSLTKDNNNNNNNNGIKKNTIIKSNNLKNSKKINVIKSQNRYNHRILRAIGYDNIIYNITTTSNHNINNTQVKNRMLRLRTSSSSSEIKSKYYVDFIPDMVSRSGVERMQEFLIAYNKIIKIDPHIRNVIEDLSKRMLVFGYNMKEWNTSPIISAFEPWEMV